MAWELRRIKSYWIRGFVPSEELNEEKMVETE